MDLPKQPSNLKLFDREIGRGAYGLVREGEFKGRPVAVKIIHKVIAKEKVFQDFIAECKLVPALDHPNIVKSYGAFQSLTDEPVPMLVLERMEENLEQYLKRCHGSLSHNRQLEICLSIASALKFLHERKPPLAHRDLSGKNVLIAKDGSVKVSDLGQSKLLEGGNPFMTTTAPGNTIYMPPEALKGGKCRYSVKIDIFSFGVLMLEIATQIPPQVGLCGIGTVPELERRSDDLAKLPDDNPLKTLIESCLQDNDNNRPDIGDIVLELKKKIYMTESKLPISVLLMGMLGAGKSAFGNFMLQEDIFRTEPGFLSVFPESKMQTTERNGFPLTIIEVSRPHCEVDLKKNLDFLERTPMIIGGVDVVCYVINLDIRFTEHETILTNSLITSEINRHLIVIFTHAGYIGSTIQEQEEYLRRTLNAARCPAGFKNLVNGAQGYIMIELRGTSDEYRSERRASILSMIKQVCTKNIGEKCIGIVDYFKNIEGYFDWNVFNLWSNTQKKQFKAVQEKEETQQNCSIN